MSCCPADVVELTRAEGRELFDRVAREELGLSGEAFFAKWDGGEYDDDDPAVARLCMLIPFAR